MSTDTTSSVIEKVEQEECTDDDKVHTFCWKCNGWTDRSAFLFFNRMIKPPTQWITTICGTLVNIYTNAVEQCDPCKPWKGALRCNKGHDLRRW